MRIASGRVNPRVLSGMSGSASLATETLFCSWPPALDAGIVTVNRDLARPLHDRIGHDEYP